MWTTASSTAPWRCPTGWRSRSSSIDDDRNAIKPGDSVLLIVEDDPAFVRSSGGRGARARNQSAGGAARSKRDRAGEELPASRHHAGRPAAGHERLDRAGSTEARSGHAAYSGACGFRSGEHRGRILPGRHDVRAEGAANRSCSTVVFAWWSIPWRARVKRLLVITGREPMRNEIHAFLAAADLDCVDAASAEDAAGDLRGRASGRDRDRLGGFRSWRASSLSSRFRSGCGRLFRR